MKRYEFFVIQKETLIVGIEAESREDAEAQLETMMDENDLNWNYADLEVYSEYNGEADTCPKFEPAEEEDDKLSKWVKQVNKDIREGIA